MSLPDLDKYMCKYVIRVNISVCIHGDQPLYVCICVYMSIHTIPM